MKESIKDTISAFNDRLRSPFYLAFALSWIFINWEIVLSLINPAFTLSKNETLISFIKPRVNIYSNILYPFLSGLSVILIVQFIDYLIGIYIDFMRNNRKEKRISMMKNVPVTGEDYVELYIKTKAANDTISDTLKSIKSKDITLANIQSKLEIVENDNFVLTTEIERKEKANKELEQLVKKLEYRPQAVDFFKGEWKIKYRQNPGSDFTIEHFRVTQNNIWQSIIAIPQGKYKHEDIFNIGIFTYDERIGTIKYFKYGVNGNIANWRIGILHQTKEDNIYIGSETSSDKTFEVIIERVK